MNISLTNQELAAAICEADRWDLDLLGELCRRAGLGAEWDFADGETFESVAFMAADVLGVKII